MLFCTFFSRRCKSATWNFLISRARFMESVNTAQEFSLISDSTPDNFAKIFQSKWNWIRSMSLKQSKFTFKWRFPLCCHPEILLPWQRDVKDFSSIIMKTKE